MSWALALLSILGGLLVAVVLLLAIPVELTVRVERRTGTRVEVILGGLAGLVHKRVLPSAQGQPPRENEEEPIEEEEPPLEEEGDGARGAIRPIVAVLRSEGFLKHTLGTIVRLVRSFTIRSLRARARFGTGDPADTGEIFGRFQAVKPATYATPRLDVQVTPDFDRRVFHGEGTVEIRVTPLRLVWIVLTYLFSRTTLRAAHAAWRARPHA